MKKLFCAVLGLACLCLAFSPVKSAEAKESNVVKLETSLGDIYVALDEEKAPLTSANFKQYVEDGFYNGTIFHRVIGNFMIQGGGLDMNLNEKPTREPIRNEADNGLKNDKYTIAMACTSAPHSATAQFFINVKNNDFLNHRDKSPAGWGYAVFGKVIKGQDVVDKIASVATRSQGGHDDVPTIPVLIKSAVLVDGAE